MVTLWNMTSISIALEPLLMDPCTYGSPPPRHRDSMIPLSCRRRCSPRIRTGNLTVSETGVLPVELESINFSRSYRYYVQQKFPSANGSSDTKNEDFLVYCQLDHR
jgi:hypothetical protein